MKRPHSYSEDLDSDDWDRPHRRFYTSTASAHTSKPKPPHDDARDLRPEVRDLRPPRKRFDHDSPNAFDHRPKPSFSDRPQPPDLFATRRDVPKGFRSERDRSRRDGGGGWRRSGELREFGEDPGRSLSREPVAEPRKQVDSDVEEGEFEPDPPEPAENNDEKLGSQGKDQDLGLDSKVEKERVVTEPVGDSEVVEVKVGVLEEERLAGSGLESPVVVLEVEEKIVEEEGQGDSSEHPEVQKEIEAAVVASADDEMKMGEDVGVVRDGTVERVTETGEGSGRVDVRLETKGGQDVERETVTLGLLINESGRDKGKAPVTSPSNDGNSMEDNDEMEGPSSSRGFELVFRPEATNLEKVNAGGIVIGKSKDGKPKVEHLDLCLALPGISANPPFQKPNLKPNSPQRTRSFQSFASSFRTNSDDFTTSISLSGSQTFLHNPSCSLQQNSMDNFEHSVHSRPIFQPIDQNPNGTVWQGQPSNEPKLKVELAPSYQRALLNGNTSHHSGNAASEHLYMSNGLPSQPNARNLHPTQSHGSQETKSEHVKENKGITRERSSSSLFRSEQREKENVVHNGIGFEKILAKIVSEPVQLVSRRIHDMTEHSVLILKRAISEILVNKEKKWELLKLQEVLSRRSDFTQDALSKAHPILLEILVSLKTGLHEFFGGASNASSSDLAEIFLDMRCRNLACRSQIPVDECDCKVCSQKKGFCSSCMCLLCSKFDLASNTCSWVGCDVCLHWCHTDCGLHNSYIRNGRSTTGAPGTTEMQFYCIACDHTSEMFGFVKDVFVTCAKDWNAETLAKELEYVRRIFSASADTRGKMLHDMAVKLLQKLENKSYLPEVYSSILGFIAETDSKPNSKSAPSSEISKKNPEGNSTMPAGVNGPVSGKNSLIGSPKEPMWHSSAPTQKLPEKLARHSSFSTERSPCAEVVASVIPSLKSPRFEIVGGALPNFNSDKLGRKSMDSEFQQSLEKKPVLDELENLVKFKQEEAKMYQTRSDEARREAEGLMRIAVAKGEKIDEEYTNRITKLRFYEAEERRRQKAEELQALEHAQHEYFSMKMRMEADIKNLLLKMENIKHNLSG